MLASFFLSVCLPAFADRFIIVTTTMFLRLIARLLLFAKLNSHMNPKRTAIIFVWLYLTSYIAISVPLGVYWAGLSLGWW